MDNKSYAISSEKYQFALGDTITVILRPLLNIPSIVLAGDTLSVLCDAPISTDGWQASLYCEVYETNLIFILSNYNTDCEWHKLKFLIPEDTPEELYDLIINANDDISDITSNSVKVIPYYRDDFYFIHITDPHTPTRYYYPESASTEDSTELEDLYAVLDDIEILNPEFVLFTGDVVNEGELEDLHSLHYMSHIQKILAEYNIPFYLP